MPSLKYSRFIGRYALVAALAMGCVSSTTIASSPGPIAPNSTEASAEFKTLMTLIYNDKKTESVSNFLTTQQSAGTDIPALLNQTSTDIELISIAKIDAYGTTPLIGACTINNPTMVELLINYGANPMLCDKFSRSPLSFTRSPTSSSAIRSLLRGKPLADHYAEEVAEQEKTHQAEAKMIRNLTKIQTRYRRNKTRKHLEAQKNARTKIQKVGRGFLGRKRARALRAEHALATAGAARLEKAENARLHGHDVSVALPTELQEIATRLVGTNEVKQRNLRTLVRNKEITFDEANQIRTALNLDLEEEREAVIAEPEAVRADAELSEAAQ